MVSQQESADSNCFSYYQAASAQYAICTHPDINVPNMSVFWDPETELDKIPTVNKTRNLLSNKTNELVSRFEKEFKRYFPKLDSDQLAMMVFHPVMVWMGFTYVLKTKIYAFFHSKSN
jgi:hypothetical protein